MPRLTGHLCEITVDLPPLTESPDDSQLFPSLQTIKLGHFYVIFVCAAIFLVLFTVK